MVRVSEFTWIVVAPGGAVCIGDETSFLLTQRLAGVTSAPFYAQGLESGFPTRGSAWWTVGGVDV